MKLNEIQTLANGTEEEVKLGILHNINGYLVSNEGTYINESYNNEDILIGTKIETVMGIKQKGTVIPWFNWIYANDGTYREPDKANYIAVAWDNKTKGFSAISNINILHDDGTKYTMGRFISDDEYDTSSDVYKIILENPTGEAGYIEFEDGTIDNFFIYDYNGKIAFDNWYPEFKTKELIDKINQKIKTQFN
jgi:hypothetical protein